jgi:PhnB protein
MTPSRQDHGRGKNRRTPKMAVSPVPSGYHTLTPYLIVDGAARALTWYAEALGARELMRLAAPGGKIGHAEIQIGDSRIMLADEAPSHGARAPGAFGGSPVSLHLYVADVDAMMARAVAAGATAKSQPVDKFYGDRLGSLADPFGHTWHIATHIEDLTAQEIERRMAAMAGPG